METMVVGAAFGKVFSELYETVKDVVIKNLEFDAILDRLKSTLAALEPLIRDIQRANRELDRPEDETKGLREKMKKGTSRVMKYSKLPRWKLIARFTCANKLCELEKDLIRFFKLEVQAMNWRNVLQILLGMKVSRGWSSCAVPGLQGDFIVGFDVPLKELKMHLLKDELNMLVVTAPPGCGKTTLVKMLCHDEQIKGIYKDIFFVPISRNPNLQVIVEKLFRKKAPNQAPEFVSDEDAIYQLEQLLSQTNGNVLLILDDAWSGSESLLDKFIKISKMPNCKILVTSRTAFTRFDFTYKLKTLSPEDAMELFRHSANLKENRPQITEKVIKKIVKSCGGFPLALEVVGRSLRGRSASVWLSRATKWSSGPIIDSEEEHLFVCLGQSLDFQDNEIVIQKCFMDLGMFPEDQKIPIAALIDMWSELYDLSPDFRAIKTLDDIAIRNLVSLLAIRKDASGVGRYSSEDFVLQHDVLRELAIRQSSQKPIEQRERLIVDITENNLPKWWVEQGQQLPLSALSLSISTDEKFLSMWSEIQPLKVEVLVLNFRTKNYTLPEFVAKMDRMKVLIVTNYGFSSAELGNFQLLGSVPNLKRIRLKKVSIPSLCKSTVELKSLKKISLFRCHIGQAFENCSIQISDAMPNLREINIDYCNDLVELPVGLCDIVSLQKFSISNCHKLSALPEGIGKLMNLEVLMLRSCTSLSELPQSIRSLHNLNLLDISDCQSIKKLPAHIGELCNLKEFHMKGCLRLQCMPLPPSIVDLKELELVTCDEVIKAKFWEPIKQEFPTNLEIKVPEKDINLNFLL